MSSMSKHHQELTDGVGKCSVPMWVDGCPSGFCDEPAYGYRPDCLTFRDAYTGEVKRVDGKYNGYVPGLACPKHGGPGFESMAKETWIAKYGRRYPWETSWAWAVGVRRVGI